MKRRKQAAVEEEDEEVDSADERAISIGAFIHGLKAVDFCASIK